MFGEKHDIAQHPQVVKDLGAAGRLGAGWPSLLGLPLSWITVNGVLNTGSCDSIYFNSCADSDVLIRNSAELCMGQSRPIGANLGERSAVIGWRGRSVSRRRENAGAFLAAITIRQVYPRSQLGITALRRQSRRSRCGSLKAPRSYLLEIPKLALAESDLPPRGSCRFHLLGNPSHLEVTRLYQIRKISMDLGRRVHVSSLASGARPGLGARGEEPRRARPPPALREIRKSQPNAPVPFARSRP
jgi:hypothetical protein